MPQPPWQAEYELHENQVCTIITTNIGIEINVAEFLGEGWDFYNWLINKRIVFRFPKRHSDIDTLVQEQRLLRKLELPLRTPSVKYWCERPLDFHKPFAGYSFLVGTPLEEVPSDDCDVARLGRTLGTCLTALHNRRLTRPLVPADPLALWFKNKKELFARVVGALSSDVLEVIKSAALAYRIRPRPSHQVTTHNDLGVEHILYDGTDLCAIIDWADAATANGFVDFAGIWAWGGAPVLKACFENYYMEPDREDLAQIRMHGTCYALEQIYYARQIHNESLCRAASAWITQRVQDGELNDIYGTL
ncbi:MAG: aminoglycoside phosphotransferase family protein [Gammaproteobacteria bacterium]|nr:aminoglycoside phosphotransferase family protein [Gammaproteobacteria bacterium]